MQRNEIGCGLVVYMLLKQRTWRQHIDTFKDGGQVGQAVNNIGHRQGKDSFSGMGISNERESRWRNQDIPQSGDTTSFNY